MDLDRFPPAKDVPVKQDIPNENTLLNIDAEYNLFDYPHCRRVILASTILSTEIAIISKKISNINELEELVIRLDYVSPLPVNNRLTHKRVLQAIGWLHRKHPNITFVIMAPTEQKYF